ncbi:MAG: hypothetical protein HY890_00560 [Deltaproteobacteria bacterium]|nr:hypothetical protein [Deltaproteobacteria bacterium]
MRHQKVKRFFTLLAIFSFFTLTALPAIAGEFGDLKVKISDARDSIVTMLKNKDKRGADQQKLVKDTADAVSAMLAKMKAPAGKEAKFKELVDTWTAFKKTRETELVPLILSGKQDDAEKLAGGIQKERFQKIMGLVDELGK